MLQATTIPPVASVPILDLPWRQVSIAAIFPSSPSRDRSRFTIMGTRGLMGFIIKGVRKGAYNQFDSYPSGLGNDIIRFILALSEEDILAMQARVEAIQWVDSGTATNHNRDLLQRLRDGQTIVADASHFIEDSLFCEYAYYVDFENRLVELVEGWGGMEGVWRFAELVEDCFERVGQVTNEDNDMGA